MLPSSSHQRIAMTAICSMKLTVSDAVLAFATAASLFSLLYVGHLFMALF